MTNEPNIRHATDHSLHVSRFDAPMAEAMRACEELDRRMELQGAWGRPSWWTPGGWVLWCTTRAEYTAFLATTIAATIASEALLDAEYWGRRA